VRGGSLKGISLALPVASAQVKTAVLLAGLRAEGRTRVSEPAASRDHTERMLPGFGVQVDRGALTAAVSGPTTLQGTQVIVPADPSSAAFICAAGLLVQGSSVRLPNVSLNPGRAGFIEVLQRMGARVNVTQLPPMGTEPVGTLAAHYSPGLKPTRVESAAVPSLVDEVPILALVATQAAGTTRFEGVGELRVKESDRLEAVRAGLQAFGASVDAGDDWLEVHGPTPLHAAAVESLGDHRLAMTWAIAALCADGDSAIEGFEAVAVSYPGFLEDVNALMTGGSTS
jgi:3-phosphoshikimate 1-carboxyvinyltransferase